MNYNSVRTILIVLLFTSPLFAFQPVDNKTEIGKKQFSLPELYISSGALPIADAPALANQSAIDRFIQRFGAQTVIYLDPRSGSAMNLVTSIPMLPGSGKSNRLTNADLSRALGRPVTQIDASVVADIFKQFVKQNSDVYGIDASQLGAVKATRINESLWHLHVPQSVNGVPVRWGRVLGVINHGNLIISGTETWGNVSISTTPDISPVMAMKKAFDFVGGKLPQDSIWKEPDLEILPLSPPQFTLTEKFDGPLGKGYGHRLAWVFGFKRSPDLSRWEMAIDAHTGEILYLYDKNDYVDKKMDGGVYPLTNTGQCPTNATCGTMQPNYPMPYADTGLPGPNDFTNGAGVFDFPIPQNVTTHLNGKYVLMADQCGPVNETAVGSLDLGGANLDTNCTSGGASPGDSPASRSGFYEINRNAARGRGWLPDNTWLQQQITANMNYPLTCNAFYDGATINFYQSGGGCRNTGEIAAVFDHEWGHGLDDNDSNGTLSDSSEGYADINAMYALWASCIGYGFFDTIDQACGLTADGSGFNNDESETATPHCDLDCSGVRDADYDKHADHVPDDVSFVCNSCGGGGGGTIVAENAGPCGRETHCASAPSRQAAWDFAAKDLPASGLDANTSFIVADRLFFQGSGNIGAWHNCTCPSSSDGCGGGNAYMQWLAADDDDGNLANGTPHMTAMFNAFNRHGMACPTPAPTNSGCASGPSTAPANVVVQAKHNQNVVSWDSIGTASNYSVFRSEGFAGCDFGKTLIATTPTNSYTDNEVVNGRTYSYVIVAVGASSACLSPASTCVQATPVACAGVPEFTRAVFSCSDGVQINLLDADLAGNGTQLVHVVSTTETAGENIDLTETTPGNFTGSISTTAGTPSDDGLLSVANGDTITVSYNDASACGSAAITTAVANVDCIAPAITNVASSAITEQSATVSWNTNEPASSRVDYGISPAPSLFVEKPTTFETAHSMDLTGLTQCSDYVYSVSSKDPATNLTTDDNSGAFYTFTTTGVGERLIDHAESGDAQWAETGDWHISDCDAFSGTHAFKAGAVECFGRYSDNSFSALTTATPIPLGPAGNNYHLTFHEKYNVEGPFDFVEIQASVDGGASWITIDHYTGDSGGWIAKDYDLSSIGGASVLIRFTLTSDDTPSSGFGWFLDDIRVSRVTPCAGSLAHFTQTIVDTCSLGGTGNGDNILDPGEDVSMTITAENIGLSGLTGVSAIVQSATPGITVTSGNTTFPNIGPESFANGISPITFSIDSSVACRTFIDFTVAFTSDQGTWNDTFQMVLGGGDPITLISEGFESNIPNSWMVVNGGSGGGASQTWTTANPRDRDIGAPFSGKFAIVDSDGAGAFATQDEQLITPTINATICAGLKLQFSNQFHDFSEGFDEVGDVDVSTDGGTNWANAFRLTFFDNGWPTPNTHDVDLTSLAAFQPNVQVRFHYYNANNDFWWAIDNVTLTCTPRICHNCGGGGGLFSDQFDDFTLPTPTEWTFTPNVTPWSEDGANLVVDSKKKTTAVAQPIFGGCVNCSVEASLQSTGGGPSRVWLLGWYVDAKNYVELMMKQKQGTWTLKQHKNGHVVKKAKGVSTINANQAYIANIAFDGTQFVVSIDGVQLFTMPVTSAPALGSVGFRVKHTVAKFDYIQVN